MMVLNSNAIRERFAVAAPSALVAATLLVTSSFASAQSQFSRDKAPPPNPYVLGEEKRPPIEKNALVLIVVNEQTRADVDANLQANRKTEANMLIDSFAHIRGGSLEPKSGPFPNVEYEGEVKTTGKGRTGRNDQIQARIQARVVDVLPNGNVRLEARRERTINSETTIITLSGETTAKSITADFTVTSDRLADLKLTYSGNGTVSGKTGSTWLSRVIDWIWPF